MRKLIVAAGAALLAAACTSNSAVEEQANVAPSTPQQAAATMTQGDEVAALSEITRILIDASDLYKAAAKDAEDPAYQAELTRLSQSRSQMADEFQARIVALGGQPPEHGQALGAAHRVFMEARTLGAEDTKVAVQEALRGENYLVEQLEEGAENAELSAPVRSFLSAKANSVRADRTQLQAYAQSLG